MNFIFLWLEYKDNINLEIINLALEVLLEIGNKEYYFKLLHICNLVKNKYIEYFDNSFYLIRRRNLN